MLSISYILPILEKEGKLTPPSILLLPEERREGLNLFFILPLPFGEGEN